MANTSDLNLSRKCSSESRDEKRTESSKRGERGRRLGCVAVKAAMKSGLKVRVDSHVEDESLFVAVKAAMKSGLKVVELDIRTVNVQG